MRLPALRRGLDSHVALQHLQQAVAGVEVRVLGPEVLEDAGVCGLPKLLRRRRIPYGIWNLLGLHQDLIPSGGDAAPARGGGIARVRLASSWGGPAVASCAEESSGGQQLCGGACAAAA